MVVMNCSHQITAVQTWKRFTLVAVGFCIFLLYIICIFIGVIFVPKFYHVSKHETTCSLHVNGRFQRGCKSDSSFVMEFYIPSLNNTFKYSPWHWRLMSTLVLNATINETTNDHANLSEEFSLQFRLNASLIERRLVLLDQNSVTDVNISDNHDDDGNLQKLNLDKGYTDSFGMEIAEIFDIRRIICTTKKNNEDSVQIYCKLNPLFDLQFLPKDSTYILNLQFLPVENETMSGSFSGLSYLNWDVYLISLTEDPSFHSAMFYIKVIFVPFVLIALVMFCARMYCHDLYISIPDRLLVAAAFITILQNIPTEVLLTYFRSSGSFLKFFESFTRLLLITVLFLFWSIFGEDKLATNEAWERNTRYYLGQILSILSIGLLGTVRIVYDQFPVLQNAFETDHWSKARLVSFHVSLSLVCCLVIFLLIYQTYFVVLVFRTRCSTGPPVTPCSCLFSNNIQFWCRTQLVLMYCLVVAFVTVASTLLEFALNMALYWKPGLDNYESASILPEVLPGAIYLSLEGLWNIHIISLLVMLSRSSNDRRGDHIRPICYRQCTQSEHQKVYGENGTDQRNCESSYKGSISATDTFEDGSLQPMMIDYYSQSMEGADSFFMKDFACATNNGGIGGSSGGIADGGTTGGSSLGATGSIINQNVGRSISPVVMRRYAAWMKEGNNGTPSGACELDGSGGGSSGLGGGTVEY